MEVETAIAALGGHGAEIKNTESAKEKQGKDAGQHKENREE